MNPYAKLAGVTGQMLGVGATCAQTAPGEDLCLYDDAPKEQQVQQILERARARLRESLSGAPAENAALSALASRVSQAAPRDKWETLSMMRHALRERASYLDDPPGRDTVRSIAATLARGLGDCLSFSVALSALGRWMLGDGGIWRLAGFADDPSRHIWPVIAGVPCDAADPMPPIGQEHGHFTRVREVSPWQ